MRLRGTIVAFLAGAPAVALAWRRRRRRRAEEAARAAGELRDEILVLVERLEAGAARRAPTPIYRRYAPGLDGLVGGRAASAVETFYESLPVVAAARSHLERLAGSAEGSLGDRIRAKDAFDASRQAARLAAEHAVRELDALRRVDEA